MEKITQEEMLEAMGWTITCYSPFEIEHVDGSVARGSSTQVVIDSIIIDYQNMKAEEAEEAEKNRKAQATGSINLEEINGVEILQFIEKQIKEDENLDLGIECPITFESQEIDKHGNYILWFKSIYNNWEDIEVYGNIKISKSGFEVGLDEPAGENGDEEKIEELLTKWLPTHKFESSEVIFEKFHNLITSSLASLEKIKFADKEPLQEIIDQLVEARTYQKLIGNSHIIE